MIVIIDYRMGNSGTQSGYNLEMIKQVDDAVKVPVVACGGAGSLQHLREAVDVGGASAVAAGSMFVFQGIRRAVLISYPKPEVLERLFT